MTSTKLYRFVKLRNEKHDIDYSWRLSCEDRVTMNKHAQTYIKPEIGKGISDIIQHAKDGFHISSYWASALLPLLMTDEEMSVLQASCKVELDLYNAKINMIENDGGVYLTDGMPYMPFSNDLIVVGELVKPTISFPNYTEKDIHVHLWPGGSHYYAKIGGLDVTDKDGNVKWNTSGMARNKALEFLETLK